MARLPFQKVYFKSCLVKGSITLASRQNVSLNWITSISLQEIDIQLCVLRSKMPMNAKRDGDALCGRSPNSGLNLKSYPYTTLLTNLSGQLLLHFLIQILRKKKTGFSSNMGVDDFPNFGDKKKSGPEFLTNSHSIL